MLSNVLSCCSSLVRVREAYTVYVRISNTLCCRSGWSKLEHIVCCCFICYSYTRCGSNCTNQGTAAAQYIGEHKLATKVAIIYDSSDVYSSGITQNFTAEAANQGIEIVSSEAFTADNNKDFSVQLQKAKDGGAELVFLPIYYTEASLILAQADSMGFETKFFGCDGMDGFLGVENFDTSLAEGLMLLTPFAADSTDEKTQNFVKAYKDAYKDTPNQFAADAYDAVYAVKAAAEKEDVKADMDVADICAALEKGMTEITLEGVTGDEITWTEDGEPNKAPKAVEIKDGAYAAIE